LFPKLDAALNFCFFCFKTKDNEELAEVAARKDRLKLFTSKCI